LPPTVTVVGTLRHCERLSLRHEDVHRARSARSEDESHAVEQEVARQQVAGDRVLPAIEVAVGGVLVGRDAVEVEGQRERRRGALIQVQPSRLHLHCDCSRLIGFEVEDHGAVGQGQGADRFLRSVDLAHRNHGAGHLERRLSGAAVLFLKPDDVLFRVLSFLDGPDGDLAGRVGQRGQRQLPASGVDARMRVGLKGQKRLIERSRTRWNLSDPPVAAVAGDRVREPVMTEVVAALVGIGAGERRVEQRQPQYVVGRLIPSVLAVVEHRRAEAAARVRDVGPLLCRHFVGFFGVVASLNGAEAEVVGGLRIRGGEWKRGLQQRVG
jgi:hypothetical protein